MRFRTAIVTSFCSSLIGASAFAGGVIPQLPFGTPEQSAPCVNQPKFWNGAWKRDANEACNAEIARRAELCLKEPAMQTFINDPTSGAHKDPARFCKEIAQGAIERDMDAYLIIREKEQKAAAAQSKLEGTELPKADQHNPTLEKAVAKAYAKDYPSGKILKVILGRWADDFEKDAFGRITGRDLYATVVNKQPDGSCQSHGELWLQHGKGKSFAGPLSPRGAGSAEDSGILCTKVEAKR
jgi:hypothetical protein